jgi:hypothetical protein
MAVDPTTLAGAVFSGLNALIKTSQQIAHFVTIPEEVKQLIKNVESADDAISTARRLQRDNPLRILGEKLIRDVDRSVEHTESILLKLRTTIDECRVELLDRNTVGVRSRTKWMLWKEKEFSGSLATLTIALGTLDRNIVRMEIAARASSPGLPNYDQAVEDGASAFPRAPSIRKSLSRRKLFNDQTNSMEDPLDKAKSTWLDDEAEGLQLARPQLVHIQSAPEEIPQRHPGSWPHQDDNEDDGLAELQTWGSDNRYLRPTGATPRRRSNYI